MRKAYLLLLLFLLFGCRGHGPSPAGDVGGSGAVPNDENVASAQTSNAPELAAAEPYRLKVLRAERDALGAVRRAVIRDATERTVALGWSGENTLLIVSAAQGNSTSLRCLNVSDSTPKEFWGTGMALPSLANCYLVFADETSTHPLLLAWTDEPRTMVQWAARVAPDTKQVVVLGGANLDTVRRKALGLKPPPDPESESRTDVRRWGTVAVVAGDGKIVRRIQLPTLAGYECDFQVPISTIYQNNFSGNRAVAYEHEPRLVLFSVDRGKLLVYPLTEDIPVAEVPTGEGVFCRTELPQGSMVRSWAESPEVPEACISADGSSLAYVRYIDGRSSVYSVSAGAPTQELFSRIYELHLVSALREAVLLDFTASMPRTEEPNARETAVDTESRLWTEPAGLPSGSEMSLRLPTLSPRGTRIAYVKNGEVWLADLPTH